MWKWLALILILIAAGAAVWGLRGRFKGNKSVRPAILVVSGDTGGWITPCGCTSNQSGGLLRRGTYLRDLAQNADVLYADAGGAPAGTSEYQRLKFQAILTGENAMHIAAHNIGGPEAQLGPAYLRETAGRLHVPMVGANVRDASGQLIAPPFRIATAGGRRIVLIGVLSPKFATPQMIVSDPKQAVVAALAQAAGQFDLSIVLAYLPDEELAQLAADLPEVDGVVGGPTGQSIAPKSTTGPLLAAATNKGKFLVQLDIPAAKSQKLSGKIVELTGAFADQDVQLANLNHYLADLGSRDLPAAQTGFAPVLPPGTPPSYRIAGSASCTSCHAAEAQIWAGTAHAHAFATLKPRGFEVDADCQQCHTTGYGLPGGFDSARRTPNRIDVGCENCHGPSQAHVSDPKVRTPFLAADQCTRCHDRENSPHFDYGTYWLRIKHGKGNLTTQSSRAVGVESQGGFCVSRDCCIELACRGSMPALMWSRLSSAVLVHTPLENVRFDAPVILTMRYSEGSRRCARSARSFGIPQDDDCPFQTVSSGGGLGQNSQGEHQICKMPQLAERPIISPRRCSAMPEAFLEN
ncbi:MAG TPA: multiheme c-type cytochrome [Tepidisphaeraceae bacterium]|nr:multiheme c-type cytochrome [Tepidisphaeraceae bacterium]